MVISEIYTLKEIRAVLDECKSDIFSASLNKNEIFDRLAFKYYENGIVFKVQYKNKIVGFAAFYANDFVNMTAFISMIILKKSFQGKGIGSILLEKIIDRSVYQNMNQLRLEVNNNNFSAIGFYKKHGFKPAGPASEISSYMVKSLF